MFQFEKHALDDFLHTLPYPSSKHDLLDKANHSELPHHLVLLMQRLEEREYTAAEDVEENLLTHKA